MKINSLIMTLKLTLITLIPQQYFSMGKKTDVRNEDLEFEQI